MCFQYIPVELLLLFIHYGLVMPYGNVDIINIVSGNDLLPDVTKPLPEHQQVLVAPEGNFTGNA